MLSQTTEYALRAIVLLAGAGAGNAMTVEQIARGTSVPVGYLAKVMQGLARANLVSSQRGLHGGFVLLRPASQVTVYDVVQAVDPIMRITACPRGLELHADQLCALHRGLDNAMGSLETAFRRLTISSFISQAQQRPALCNEPERGTGK